MSLLKNINKLIHKNVFVYFIIGLILFYFIYSFFSQLFIIKEGFVWDDKSTQHFLLIQHTINQKKIFDVNMIQENQASQEELDYFNKTLQLYLSRKNDLPCKKKNCMIKIDNFEVYN